MDNPRICKRCLLLFDGTEGTHPRCPGCKAGGPHHPGWSVHLDRADPEVLAGLIPAMVRKVESINERLDRLEAKVTRA